MHSTRREKRRVFTRSHLSVLPSHFKQTPVWFFGRVLQPLGRQEITSYFTEIGTKNCCGRLPMNLQIGGLINTTECVDNIVIPISCAVVFTCFQIRKVFNPGLQTRPIVNPADGVHGASYPVGRTDHVNIENKQRGFSDGQATPQTLYAPPSAESEVAREWKSYEPEG